MKKRTGSLSAFVLLSSTAFAAAQVNTIITPGSITTSTGPVTVAQANANNSVGVAQVGGSPTATIVQSGFFNKAAVAQAGTVNTATVTQTGSFNRSCVAQFGPTNSAGVNQSGGGFNSSLVFQTATGAPSPLSTYVQNCLNGPESTTPNPGLGQTAAISFTNVLFNQLDNDRWQPCTETPAPIVTKGPMPAPVTRCSQWSVFLLGTYGDGNRDDQAGISGLSYKLYSVTGGVEYHVSPNLLFGVAGNFTRTNADLNFGLGSTSLDTSQIGVFGSYFASNFFLDGLLTWGFHDFLITRPAFTSPATANPGGTSFTAAARAGYLFDVGSTRLGPIAGVTHAHTKVDAYTEVGDPLLTQSVNSQSAQALIGSVGGQIRYPYMFGQMKIDPYVNLTAEHDFKGGDLRVVTTTFTQSPSVLVFTPAVGTGTSGTYGKVQGGVNIYVTPLMSALISAESTFARSGGNDFAVTAGFKASF